MFARVLFFRSMLSILPYPGFKAVLWVPSIVVLSCLIAATAHKICYETHGYPARLQTHC